MSNATTVAAVAGGYLLGRTKKMKLALMLAAMLAGKKLPSGGSGLTSQLTDLVQSNPELSNLMKQIQGNLTQAARAAAVTAATQQVNRLSDNLHNRAEALKTPLGSLEGEQSDEESDAEEESGQEQQSSEGSGKKSRKDSGSGDDTSAGDEEDSGGSDESDEEDSSSDSEESTDESSGEGDETTDEGDETSDEDSDGGSDASDEQSDKDEDR